MPLLEAIRAQFEYTAWASTRLLAAAGELSDEELNRDFGTADKSVLGTLVHVFSADRVWLGRVHGQSLGVVVTATDNRLGVLKNVWPGVLDEWKAWAAEQSEESVHTVLDYRDMKGHAWSSPLWQVALHVVNHATHHRGQVAGMLRALGHKPPVLDLMAYYREPKG
jgi:uncharacterized damage-inducible protein DinB